MEKHESAPCVLAIMRSSWSLSTSSPRYSELRRSVVAAGALVDVDTKGFVVVSKKL